MEAAHALAVIRPEHVELVPWAEAPGAVKGRIAGRRFAGAELHYEVELATGFRLWVEAGPAARRLGVSDDVGLTLRPVETVAFAAPET